MAKRNRHWLIKREPRSPTWHADYVWHPVILCADRWTAKWCAGDSTDGRTVWYQEGIGAGWLLERWRGLVVDYGHLVRSFDMPDGSRSGFQHNGEPWNLLPRAVWWSSLPMPDYVRRLGVRDPTDGKTLAEVDRASLKQIADDEASGRQMAEERRLWKEGWR